MAEKICLRAIIIKTFASGEADLVLRLLSLEQGKLSAIAKYARKSKKRFAAHFDLFDRGTFELSRGRGSLLIVQGLSPLKPLMALRADLDKLSAASLVCEAFDILLKEEADHSPALFETLDTALENIDQAQSIQDLLRGVFLCLTELLKLTGFHALKTESKPSTRLLRNTLTLVESHAERKLLSLEAFEQVLQNYEQKHLKQP